MYDYKCRLCDRLDRNMSLETLISAGRLCYISATQTFTDSNNCVGFRVSTTWDEGIEYLLFYLCTKIANLAYSTLRVCVGY